jgi:tetratricopeptide (TPR) repeat protein
MAAPARKGTVRPGRNDPCACGSGRKYKKCCGQSFPSAPPGQLQTPPASELNELEILAQAGRHAELEEKARALLAGNPQLGLLWKLLALALWNQGKDAVQELRMAARLLPHDAEAHTNLGNALRGCGQLEEARRCHQQALALRPDYADAHNNLGCALQELGRVEQAVASYRRAIALNSDFVTAHGNLGAALRLCGAHAEAIDHFRHAASLRPDAAELHRRLASALMDLGRFDEAAASYRDALAVDPGAAALHSDLGWALAQQGRTAEAESSCTRALEIDPRLVAAIVLRADLAATKGEFAEAHRLLRQALALEPDCPEAWAGLMQCGAVAGGDQGWLDAAVRVAGRSLPAAREARLRFAIAKYFDAVQNYAEAFANYRRANELVRQQAPRYPRREVTLYADLITQLYDRDWLAQARNSGSGSERAVFIVGMWRSGTTLAEQILASHPEVFGAGELPYWKHAALQYETSFPGTESGDRERLGALAADFLAHTHELSGDAARVIDKMSANFLHLGLIHAALPEARIIHMQRDPLDTCLSMYFQSFLQTHAYATDLEDLAHYYTQYHRVMDHWRRTLPQQVLLEVEYEQLVEQPEHWSRRMLEFIGLPWNARCLAFHRNERAVTTFSRWQVRQPINRSAVGRWRNYERFIEPLLSLRGLPRA